MQTLNRSDHREQYNFLPSALLDKMDHHQKIQMVVVPQQSKIKIEDDDDEDVEALRLAALKSLRTKDTTHKRSTLSQVPKVLPQVTQSSRFSYKNQRPIKRNFYSNRVQQRQNGNMYYQSPRNPNLIAIVPVDEPSPLQQPPLSCPIEKTEPRVELSPQVSEISKFHRFKDNGSASEEEDTKEQKSIVTSVKTDLVAKEEPEQSLAEVESQEEITKSPQKNGDNQEEDGNDDDDDIILMADIEEENSLERLMDEMEREMNDGNKPSEKREKKLNKEETKVKMSDEGSKSFEQKTKSDEICSKKERNTTTLSLTTVVRNDRRSDSPHIVNRVSQKRKSLSPRSRSRKKSPKRSPRRSPVRQPKKSPRESTRYRSPRRSPSSRYSPRSRSPRLSPRRSPNRTSMKRSPPRKLSPRGRSPKLSSRSRSPRPHRSRSPRRLSRSKSPRPRSPKVSRSRSPRLSRSRSPRYSPLLRSPRSKSPRLSPRRMSPRRLRSRSRSPALSPPRREPSRLRSPKGSPRRTSPRLRSPRLSPHRSPWSSPRHSPRLSPRRRRSPKWSPKELPRKHGPRSITPDNRDGYAREPSPIFKGAVTPEMPRAKIKQKDEVYERPTTTTETAKESVDTISDPVLEARRKKFESTRPIDPVNANKKIKLSKKYTTNTKAESSEEMEIQSSTIRKTNKTLEEYEVQEMDLCLETSYEFEEFEEAVENTSPSVITSSVNTCIDIEPQKTEKEKSSKKKKKRDKELYQVGGKLKNELPLSERIGKDKKCKKRKEIISEEDVDTIFEDMAIDTEEGDLRTELSRRRAERLNRPVPIQSARLVQSAFKGVVNDAVKNNAKVNQRHVINTDEKSNQKEVRRVTVLHRSPTYLHDSEDESTLDSKVPVRFRLGLNKQPQESRESKVTRKASKRQGRKE